MKIKAGKRRGNVMDYVRILYTYIVEDFMYSGAAAVSDISGTNGNQSKAKFQACACKILFWSLCNACLSVDGI